MVRNKKETYICANDIRDTEETAFAIEIGIAIEIVAPDLSLAKARRTPRNFRWDISNVRRDIPRSEESDRLGTQKNGIGFMPDCFEFVGL